MPQRAGEAMRVTRDHHNNDRNSHEAHRFTHYPTLQILLENENGREEKSIHPCRFNARCLDAEAVLMYAFTPYKEEHAMPRAAVGDNNRVALRVRPADKATIMRAAALAQTDMTSFILRTVLREAQSVIEEHERVKLTERDSRLVMKLLENPPAPNAKLRKAARAMPKRS
jgi:uncharacterized protein (DUF1778 family)